MKIQKLENFKKYLEKGCIGILNSKIPSKNEILNISNKKDNFFSILFDQKNQKHVAFTCNKNSRKMEDK